MESSISLPDGDWQKELPASESAVQNLLAESGLELPQDYLQFLRLSDGGGGELGGFSGYFFLYAAQEVMEANQGYEVAQWLPGFFGIGHSGGGELLAFDTRTPQPWKIHSIPFIPMMEEDAILVAKSFADFVSLIGQITPEENP